jgi:hypothetical protein
MNSILRVPLGRDHLPVATGFVAATAKAYGGDDGQQYALELALEEIFLRICGSMPAGAELHLEIRDGGYCLELRLLFPAGALEFGAFNLTARSAVEGGSLHDLGLYIAARLVDSLRVRFEGRDKVSLTLIKERKYPEASREARPEQAAPEAAFGIVRPSPEQMKLFAELAASRFPGESLPDFLRRPGKAADMLRAGALDAAVAATPRGALGGGVFWQPEGAKTVEMTGPYVLPGDRHDEVLDQLLEECIRRTARTRATGVFCRLTPHKLGAGHFEILGETNRSQKFYYRHLVEDEGAVVFCHPCVEEFLHREYGRLVLPRELRPVKDCGERMAEFSLLACDFRFSSASVTLRGLVAGEDAAGNLAAHLARFEHDGTRDIRFELDLGEPWLAPFAPTLLAAGMVPVAVVPNAGAGDLLIFERAGR